MAKKSKMSSSGSTVVKNSPHYPKAKGLSPATATVTCKRENSKNSKMSIRGSTVVNNSAHYSKAEGLSPATATAIVSNKMAKNLNV